MTGRTLHIVACPGVDWSRVAWGGPSEPQSWCCSYCRAPIDEESSPLRLWRQDGAAAVFCDGCAGDVFGARNYPDPTFPDPPNPDLPNPDLPNSKLAEES